MTAISPTEWRSSVRGMMEASSPGFRLAATLIAIDLILVVVYIVSGVRIVMQWQSGMPPIINLDHEASLQSYFNVAKWIFISSSLLWIYWRTRDLTFLAFAFCFALVTLDDSLALHETLGASLAELGVLPGFLGMTPHDLGELAILALNGAAIAAAVVAAFVCGRAEHVSFRYGFLALLAALGFCAVGLDVLGALISSSSEDPVSVLLAGVAILAEEGGELVVASITCGLTLAAMRNIRAEPARHMRWG